MGKIHRKRMIDNISNALLNLYLKYDINDPVLKEKQGEILNAFKVQLQTQGKSRTTINDYLSTSVVKALDTYDRMGGK